MPHKHKRLKTLSSDASHELPPTSLAQPLPVSKNPPTHQSTKSYKRKYDPKDDTPRAFTRLMAYASTGHKTPRGLDDGSSASKSKKGKRGNDNTEHQEQRDNLQPNHTDTTSSTEIPKILPGERMGDYAARVDQAIPISGLVNKGKGKSIAGLKERQTKMERKMQRMQEKWREEEARWKERAQEAEEEAAAEDNGEVAAEVGGSGRGKKKKGKRRKGKGGGGTEGESDDDGDPWAVVAANRRREQEEKEKGDGKGGLVGLHDVVQAPPKFTRVPKRKLDVADVVRKGGLKRQVELSEARQSVVEGYRRLMKDRREGVAVGASA
ncbi:MAG: hypothetical protein Q9166_003478 [cf. Caloplaca sp. 2 TL-2023]